MATLKPKEFDPTMLLKIQKFQADSIINAEKAGEKIGAQKVEQDLAGYKEDADSWLRNWRTERGLPADSGVLPNNRDEVPPHLRGWIFPRADASPQDGMKIAKKKRNEQRAYEDFVRDSQNMPLEESFKDLRRGQDGEGFDILRELLDLDEAKNRLKINPKVAMSPADVPLGDGMIYEAKTQMQKNLKQKYDLMLENGFIDEVEYKKQMDRLFGTKGKK